MPVTVCRILKSISLLPSSLVVLMAAPAALAAPRFDISPKGVTIESGGTSKLTIAPQSFSRKSGQEKPVLSAAGPKELEAQFASGALLKIQVTDQQVLCKYSGLPADGQSFKFSLTLPIRFNLGGKFAFDGAALRPFPAEKGEQFVQRGNAREFTLIDPQGDGFRFVSPGGYQYLQDNRVFRTQTFSYSFKVDTGGKTDGSFVFRVKPASSETGQDEGQAETQVPVNALVDRFGQSTAKEYPGKVRSEMELKADASQQLAEMESFKPDPELDLYGGLAGSQEKYKLKKTGFFRVDEVNGRKALVDPEGNIFFQLGVCGISNTDDYTVVKGREKTFEWIPEKSGEFTTAFRGEPKNGIVSYYIANWIRKFGKPFDAGEWTKQAVFRLRSWGFNSAGAFCSNGETLQELHFPRVAMLPLSDRAGVRCLPDKIGAGKVLDPFSPGIEQKLDTIFAEKVAPQANNPQIIGYFLGNEQHFETLPKVIPAYNGRTVAAKARLVEILKEKYKDINTFNKAWEVAKPLSDFEAAIDEPLFVRTEAAAEDMREFFRDYLESYYSLVERVFRKHDPNHLLIGSRWTPGTANNKDVVQIGSKHLDVISVNYYTYGVEKGFLKKLSEWSGDKPLILSEWHYGTVEHGLTAHMEVQTEEERASAFRNYMEQAAATPTVVGTQWFIYTDQAITGRFFQGFHGEGFNTGLVDVTDRPYRTLVAAAQASHNRIYDVMLGKEKPFAFNDPRFDGASRSAGQRKAQAPKAEQGMALDGTTIGWPTRPAVPIGSDRIVRGNPNPNIRGDFRLCWDEANLYFHILVKDPSPMKSNKTGSSLWSGDAVEIFLGPKKPEEPGSPIFSDRQILVRATQEPEVYIAYHPEEAKLIRAVVTPEVSGDGYAMLVVIPWRTLECEPWPGLEILFDVAIDNSEDGYLRAHQAVWNGTAGNSQNRGGWGRLSIVGN